MARLVSATTTVCSGPPSTYESTISTAQFGARPNGRDVLEGQSVDLLVEGQLFLCSVSKDRRSDSAPSVSRPPV